MSTSLYFWMGRNQSEEPLDYPGSLSIIVSFAVGISWNPSTYGVNTSESKDGGKHA